MLLKETAPPDVGLALPPSSRPETITLGYHDRLGWRRAESIAFARNLATQPLAADEIVRVAQSMSIGIRRDQDSWVVVAIFSDAVGENLYVDQHGKWLGAYIPAALRVFPFRLSPEVPDALALWPGSEPQALDDHCEPFFVGGQLAPVPARALQVLRTVRAGITALAEPLAFLAERGVLVEWHFPPRPQSCGKVPLADIWRVDAERLDALGDSDWLMLRRMRALPWVHAHLASIHHAAGFQRRATLAAQTSAIGPSSPGSERKASPEAEDFLALVAAALNGNGT